MIGWHTSYANDMATAIVNGDVDRDLDQLISYIHQRQAIKRYGPCPVCNEPLIEEHTHDDLCITRVRQPS